MGNAGFIYHPSEVNEKMEWIHNHAVKMAGLVPAVEAVKEKP